MSRISYIASSGGLLGLCMGFSFVSLAEIAYHCFICCGLLCGAGSGGAKSVESFHDAEAGNNGKKSRGRRHPANGAGAFGSPGGSGSGGDPG